MIFYIRLVSELVYYKVYYRVYYRIVPQMISVRGRRSSKYKYKVKRSNSSPPIIAYTIPMQQDMPPLDLLDTKSPDSVKMKRSNSCPGDIILSRLLSPLPLSVTYTPPEESEKSAGIIFIDKKRRKTLLVHGRAHDKYSFPKGKFIDGDNFKKCGIRETYEETGIDCTHLLNNDNNFITIQIHNNENRRYFIIETSIYKYKNCSPIDTKEIEFMDWISFDDILLENAYLKLIKRNLNYCARRNNPKLSYNNIRNIVNKDYEIYANRSRYNTDVRNYILGNYAIVKE